MKKTYILLFSLALFFSCSQKQELKPSEYLGFSVDEIAEKLASKQQSYINFKQNCIGQVPQVINNKENECLNCISIDKKYFVWKENNQCFIKKYDKCSEYFILEIKDFNPIKYFEKNLKKFENEKPPTYINKDGGYMSPSHSCYREYRFFDGEKIFAKHFDLFSLANMEYNPNVNYESNKRLAIIQLDKKLSKITSELEKENKFKRDKSTCVEFGKKDKQR